MYADVFAILSVNKLIIDILTRKNDWKNDDEKKQRFFRKRQNL